MNIDDVMKAAQHYADAQEGWNSDAEAMQKLRISIELAIDQVMSEIKLYAWQPDGHGEYSFFVAASSEKEAEEAVEKYISDHKNKYDGHHLGDYEIGGCGTDYYKLTVFSVGEVVTNDNS